MDQKARPIAVGTNQIAFKIFCFGELSLVEYFKKPTERYKFFG